MNINTGDIQIKITQDNPPQPIISEPEIKVTLDNPQQKDENQLIGDGEHDEYVLSGKIGALLQKAKKDYPDSGDLRVEVQPEMAGDAMVLGEDRDPDSPGQAWYKGTVMIRIVAPDGTELGRAEHTIFTPNRVSQDDYENQKSQGCAQDSILLICDAHEYVFNTKITATIDSATKTKIEKMKKVLDSGFIPVEFSSHNKIKSAIVIHKKDDKDNVMKDEKGEILTEELSIPEKLYERVDRQNGRIWSPRREIFDESMHSDPSRYLKAREYKPRVVLKKDKEAVELAHSSKGNIVDKVKDDKSRLPKLLEVNSRETKWRNQELNRIKDQLLNSQGELSEDTKRYLEHNNESDRLKQTEGTLENQIMKADKEIKRQEGILEGIRQEETTLKQLIGIIESEMYGELRDADNEHLKTYITQTLGLQVPSYPYGENFINTLQTKVINEHGKIKTLLKETEQEIMKANLEKSEKTKELSQIKRSYEHHSEMLHHLLEDYTSTGETLQELINKKDDLKLDNKDLESIDRELKTIQSEQKKINELLQKLGGRETQSVEQNNRINTEHKLKKEEYQETVDMLNSLLIELDNLNGPPSPELLKRAKRINRNQANQEVWTQEFIMQVKQKFNEDKEFFSQVIVEYDKLLSPLENELKDLNLVKKQGTRNLEELHENENVIEELNQDKIIGEQLSKKTDMNETQQTQFNQLKTQSATLKNNIELLQAHWETKDETQYNENLSKLSRMTEDLKLLEKNLRLLSPVEGERPDEIKQELLNVESMRTRLKELDEKRFSW